MKIIAFQTITNHIFCSFDIGAKPVVYIINRKIHGCLEIPDLFLVLNMIFHDIMFNTRNKSGTSAHPCIILVHKNKLDESQRVTLHRARCFYLKRRSD